MLPCSCNKGVLRLPKNPYTAHQQAARNLPNSFFVKDKSELRAGKSRGNLVDVTDGRGYHIAPLSHSHAMLLPDVKALLEDMGRRAVARGDEERGDHIPRDELDANGPTSPPRPPQYNAIDGGSTHSYGASFDIAYTDRPNNEADCSAPTGHSARSENVPEIGRILVIPEKNMHIASSEACAALQVDDFVVEQLQLPSPLAQCRVRVDGLEARDRWFQLAQGDQFGDHLRNVCADRAPPNNSPYFASNTSLTIRPCGQRRSPCPMLRTGICPP